MGVKPKARRIAELQRIARERGYSVFPRFLLVNGTWYDMETAKVLTVFEVEERLGLPL